MCCITVIQMTELLEAENKIEFSLSANLHNAVKYLCVLVGTSLNIKADFISVQLL